MEIERLDCIVYKFVFFHPHYWLRNEYSKTDEMCKHKIVCLGNKTTYKFVHNIYKVTYTYPESQYSTPPSYHPHIGFQISIFIFFYSKNLFLSLYSHGYLEKSCIFSSHSQVYKIVLLKKKLH